MPTSQHDPNPVQHREYPNTGVLWVNNQKREERDRDSRGDATIDGVDYWISGWNREKKNGETYVKLYFKKKESQAQGAPNFHAETPRA